MKVYKCICKRCSHVWIPQVSKPLHCPKCKSPYWNRPYTRSDIVLKLEKVNSLG